MQHGVYIVLQVFGSKGLIQSQLLHVQYACIEGAHIIR